MGLVFKNILISISYILLVLMAWILLFWLIFGWIFCVVNKNIGVLWALSSLFFVVIGKIAIIFRK